MVRTFILRRTIHRIHFRPFYVGVAAQNTVFEEGTVSPPDSEASADVITETLLNADVVDVDTEKSDDYEYYYVYYDEDGNIVNKTTEAATASPQPDTAPLNKNKLQEVTLNTISTVSSDVQTGDTPTLYAGIKNITEHEEPDKVDSDDDDGGLKIFGIPIPKIPLPILSFGLTPALSHGLLPIGRKGDPASTVDADRRTKLPPIQTDYTRGPDSIDPIWIDSKESFQEEPHPKRHIGKQQYFPQSSDNTKTTKPYGYLQPLNPIIPLKDPNPYFPKEDAQSVSSEQYPKGYVPAIQFDHPISDPRPGSSPIVPNPNLQSGRPQTPHYRPPPLPSRTQPYQPAPVRDTVDGFVPMFTPNKADEHFRPLPPPSAFPGIDATLSYPAVPKGPIPLTTTTDPPVVWGHQGGFEDQEKPMYEYEYEYYDEDEAPSASSLSTTTAKAPTTLKPITITTPSSVEQIETSESRDEMKSVDKNLTQPEYEYEYYYEYYEDDEKVNSTSKTTTTTSTTTTTEAPPLPTTLEASSLSVEEEQAASVSLQNILNLIDDDNAETSVEFASTVHSLMADDLHKKRETLNDVTVKSPGDASSSSRPAFYVSTARPTPPTPVRTSTLTPFDTNFLDSQRSTTAYDVSKRREDFFAQWQESVQRQTEKNPRSSTKESAYPFHPDQMDPASAAENGPDDSDVKWYYSNYNNENLDPFVSPSRGDPPHDSGGSSGLVSSVLCVVLPFVALTFH